MLRIILESPFAAFDNRTVEDNVEYARKCVRDSLSRWEAPIASHLLYTQDGILDDNIPHERKWWIDAWLVWKEVADKHVFYIDYWMSRGMKYALEYATKNNIPVEYRTLF